MGQRVGMLDNESKDVSPPPGFCLLTCENNTFQPPPPPHRVGVRAGELEVLVTKAGAPCTRHRLRACVLSRRDTPSCRNKHGAMCSFFLTAADRISGDRNEITKNQSPQPICPQCALGDTARTGFPPLFLYLKLHGLLCH